MDNKQYFWDANAEIPMKGNEFQLFINGLKQILSTPEAQNILMLAEMAKIADRMMQSSIENGTFKEEPPQPELPKMQLVD